MPFRSRASLADWLVEFDALEHSVEVDARVIEQDGSQGADTGLVAVRTTGGLEVYIQPDDPDSARWVVTIEAREEATELSPAQATRLSAEFATIAALCAFLEEKSLAAGE